MAGKKAMFLCAYLRLRLGAKKKKKLLGNLGHVMCAVWCTTERAQEGALCNSASAEFYFCTHNATAPLKITGGKHCRDVLRERV